MALEYTQNSVMKCEKIFEGSCEQSVDLEINLPDYCADILRILKCTVTPCIVSSKISGDRACTDGNVLIRIVYCDEEDNICTAEQSVPFSKYVETGADNDGTLFVSAKSEYVNCRAVSRRKAEIHGTVRFLFKIQKIAADDFISSVESAGTEVKCGSIDFSSVTSCECKLFPLNETAELPEDYPSAQKIINVCAVPLLSETKIIKGKLLLKGDVSVSIIYCTDKNKGECTEFSYNIPVNQVIDAAGLSEEGFADVRLKISGCDVSAREDSDGAPRLLDINLVAAAEITAYVNKESEYITDAYSTAGELTADYRSIEFYKFPKRINDTFTSSGKFDFSAVSAQKLLCVWFGEPEMKAPEDSADELNGKVPVYFILSDSDGKPVFCERELELHCGFNGKGFLAAAPNVSLSGYTTSSSPSGGTEIKAEFIIEAYAFEKKKLRVMTSADVSERSGKSENSGITVYFPDDGEKLWDIARKFGTTEQCIKKENDITGDSFDKNGPLVIPC